MAAPGRAEAVGWGVRVPPCSLLCSFPEAASRKVFGDLVVTKGLPVVDALIRRLHAVLLNLCIFRAS